MNIKDIFKRYDEVCSVKDSSMWMNNFFDTLTLDMSVLNFDKHKKYIHLNHDCNDILFFRFEDMNYIITNVLPKYNINVKQKINVSSQKIYASLYKEHKDKYKVNRQEIENINSSMFLNIFYSKQDIHNQIKKYS